MMLTGKAVAEKELHTAGKPDHIELVADRNVIKADGKDLSFVTVRVVDRDGNLCPDASHEISFKVKGEGSYRAGELMVMQPFLGIFPASEDESLQRYDDCYCIFDRATGQK